MASVQVDYRQAYVKEEERQQTGYESLSDDESRPSSPGSSSQTSSDESTDSGAGSPQRILMLDPSELFRPELVAEHGKAVGQFRKYSEVDEDPIQKRVRQTYYKMHANNTVEFVQKRMERWNKFDNAHLTIMEALEKLNGLVDESDPDSDLPNIVHAFQTAERIRAAHPDQDWFHLTGLIHDLGKVLAFWGDEQWAVVGDTYVLGCQFADSIVYRQHSFDTNPDLVDERYNTKYGIYKPNCGLQNVLFNSSHDVYLYRVLKNHPDCSLPEAGLKCILLHSFYPWHTGGDYMHLCSPEDLDFLPLVREFNTFDLYTKSAPVPDIKALMPYYQSLIDKYIPGKIKW